MVERPRETCGTCGGSGRVVDERQAGEPVATCMTCKGNGWVYSARKEG
jgi:DnaJ-class molecular chaperone